MSGRPHIAVYGSVRMYRGDCPRCGELVLFPAGLSACCGATIAEAQHFKVMSVGGWRGRPPVWRQREILKAQGWLCLYCDKPFETLRRACWDHFVPLSLAQNNANANFVAACGDCNRRKSNLVFETVEQVRTYLERLRAKREARASSPDTRSPVPPVLSVGVANA